MNLSDVIAFIAVVVSGIAVFQTHKANEKADIANKLASDANRQSSKANELSKSANDIANKAFELGRVQDLRETTHEVVDWRLDVNNDWDIRITNIGAHTAHNVTMLIAIHPDAEHSSAEWRFNDFRDGIDRVAPGGQIAFTSSDLVDVREKARKNFVLMVVSDGVLYDHRAHGELCITIFWENSVGVQSRKILEKHLD